MTTTWGVWQPARVSVDRPADTYALPSRITTDIVLADALIKGQGYRGAYESVIVTWPKDLPLWRNQPYYCFLMEGHDPDFVYVGVNNRDVLTSLPERGRSTG